MCRLHFELSYRSFILLFYFWINCCQIYTELTKQISTFFCNLQVFLFIILETSKRGMIIISTLSVKNLIVFWWISFCKHWTFHRIWVMALSTHDAFFFFLFEVKENNLSFLTCGHSYVYITEQYIIITYLACTLYRKIPCKLCANFEINWNCMNFHLCIMNLFLYSIYPVKKPFIFLYICISLLSHFISFVKAIYFLFINCIILMIKLIQYEGM